MNSDKDLIIVALLTAVLFTLLGVAIGNEWMLTKMLNSKHCVSYRHLDTKCWKAVVTK